MKGPFKTRISAALDAAREVERLCNEVLDESPEAARAYTAEAADVELFELLAEASTRLGAAGRRMEQLMLVSRKMSSLPDRGRPWLLRVIEAVEAGNAAAAADCPCEGCSARRRAAVEAAQRAGAAS